MPADVGHDCCTVTCNIQLWTGGQTAETGGEMFIDFAAAERLTDVCSPVISAYLRFGDYKCLSYNLQV